MRDKDVTLSIIIPVYNEVNTVLEVVRLVQKEPHKKEIIIVDDCSSDGTREFLKEITDPNIKIIFNDRNRGKGYCVREGIKQVSGDIVIIQDADLEYYPDEYGHLIEKIVEGKADVVYGSRFLGSHRVFHFYHYLGNALLNIIANIMLDANLTDLMTCYKAFRTPLIKDLTLKANRFGIETEITVEAFKRRYRVYEVPISYNGRTYDEGKKIRWTDFFRCIAWLLRSMARGIDVGEDTLLRIRLLHNNTAWVFNKLKPYVGNKILELGSGIGTFSKYLAQDQKEVTLLDINEQYTAYLQDRFIGNKHVKVIRADAGNLEEILGDEHFDTVVALNILEHIEDDTKALAAIKNHLTDNGCFTILVPAHQVLFSPFDEKISHYRRYSKKELCGKLERCGLRVEKVEYMDFLGAIGWFVNFKILRKKRIPTMTTRLFDLFIPAIAFLEKYIKFPFGISLFCVARLK